MASARNHAIDTIKGVLILLVVAGHAASPAGNKIIPLFQEWLYLFHMPAFFILGCLFIKNLRKEFSSTLPLLACYILWLVLPNRKHLEIIPYSLLLSNWASLKSILWFLPALVTFKYIFAILKIHKLALYMLLPFCFLVIFFNRLVQEYHSIIPWGIDIAIYLIPIAVVSSRYFDSNAGQLNFNANFDQQDKKIAFSLLIFFIFSLLFYFRIPKNTFTAHHHRLDLAQFSVPGIEGYLYLLLMMLSLINIAKMNIQENYLSMLGKKSLSIFIFHMSAFRLIDHFFELESWFGWTLKICLSVFICIAVSITLLRISKWFRYVGA